MPRDLSREMTRARENLCARDQRVFVGAVQRVAGLEGQRALPLALSNECAGHPRREHVLAVIGIDGLRECAQRAPEQMSARIAFDRAPTRMIESIRPVHLLDIAGLVPREGFEFVDDPDQRARLVSQRGRPSRGQ